MDALNHKIKNNISSLKKMGQFRKLLTLSSNVKVFCSNDYLGLSFHPRVLKSAQDALLKYGLGSTGSRYISGNHDLYQLLEQKIAQLKNKEDSFVFSSGYLANLGILNALCDKGDMILFDRLSHASLIDSIRLNSAWSHSFKHNCVESLKKQLQKKRSQYDLCCIVTEGVFSMEGDIPPLKEYLDLAHQYDAFLLIDEAHSTGTIGPHGFGVSDYFQLNDQRMIIMGTLSKALGSLGGFVCSSTNIIEYIRNRARTGIFSTALPASICAGAIEAIQIISESPKLIHNLQKKVAIFNDQLKTPIYSIRVGCPHKVVKLRNELLEEGYFLQAIRYPTVPKNTERLRMTFSVKQTDRDILKLKKILESNQLIPS